MASRLDPWSIPVAPTLLLALASLALLPAGEADGTAPMPGLVQPVADAAAVEVDGKVFLFGGKPCAGGCAPTNEIVEYDLASGNVSAVASLPSGRSGAAAVYGPGAQIYVFGGTANGTALDEVVRFDPATREVRTMNATLPSARHGAAAVWASEGVRLLGGINASGLLDETLFYNVTADAFSPSNLTLPEPRAHMAIVDAWGAAYLLGGENATGFTDSILVHEGWSSANQTISEVGARLPFPVAGASAAWGDGNAFVFGGLTAEGVTDAVVRYDPDEDRAIRMNATLPSARNGTAAAYSFYHGESFYVFGGSNATGDALDEVVRYHATPDAPTNLTATATATGIALAWTAPPEDTYSYLTGYRIYRGASPGNLTILAYAWPPGNDTWHDQTVAPGTTWHYALRAYSNTKVGPQSDVATATYGHVPGAPRNLTAEGLVGAVLLEWEAPADPGSPALSEYRVYRHNETLGYVLVANVSGTNHTDGDLGGNETFRYVVRAANGLGEGNASNEANATTLPRRAPSPPQNLTAWGISGGAALSWSPPADEGTAPVDSYQVWRGRYPGERWYGFGVPASQTWFNDSIPRGETYWYEVTAASAHGTSGPSGNVSASGLYAPTAPRDLAVASGPGMLNLTWTLPEHAGTSPVSGYRVYGGNASGATTLLAEVGNVTSWTDAPLPVNLTRYYRVAALNDVGESAWSAEASNATWATPGEPRDLQATGGLRLVNLTWLAPASPGGGPVTEYRIYRDGAHVATVDGSLLAYSDQGLANGTSYTYRVSAVNAAGEGPKGANATATTFALPTAPRDLTAAKTLSGIRLDWQAPSADGGTPVQWYVVYRSLSSGSDGVAIAQPTGLTYTDAGCPLGSICYYRVAAVNLVGEGAKSNQAWAIG